MPRRRPSLPEVTATGDRRASLEALRQLLAAAIAEKPVARDLAPLTRQLALVMAEIADLRDVKVVTPLDEIQARRAARGADPEAV